MRISVFDIGGTFIKCGIFDGISVVPMCNMPTEPQLGAEHILRTVTTVLKEQLAGGPIDGIGISTRGQVDFLHGVIIYDDPDIVPDYSGFAIKKRLREELAQILSEESAHTIPVVIENDGNCAALAESRLGAAKDFSDCLCVVFGTSIGGAIIQGRELFHGSSWSAGEFGMMYFPDPSACGLPEAGQPGPDACSLPEADQPGPDACTFPGASRPGPDACTFPGASRPGCLTYESYASTSQLVRLARALDASLTDGRAVARGIAEGNPAALSAARTWSRRAAIGLASLIHCFNPPCVVLGGGIMEDASIVSMVREQTLLLLAPGFGHVQLLPAKLGNQAGMLGAGCLVSEIVQLPI